MDKKNLFLIIWMTGVLLLTVIVGCLLFVNPKEENSTETEDTTLTEEMETPVEETTLELVGEEPTPEYVEYVFTSEEKDLITETFTPLLENQEYQTSVSANDILVDIKFKDYGTVTFKMYKETAPTAVDWFISLKDVKTESTETSKKALKFQFITTDRVYETDEEKAEIFPIKYCLYQIMNSCNNFYICKGDYIENETDSYNIDESYINFFKEYGGDFSVFKECIVLGYAINGHDILDVLPSDFVIESITLKNQDVVTSNNITETVEENSSETDEESVNEVIEETTETDIETE